MATARLRVPPLHVRDHPGREQQPAGRATGNAPGLPQLLDGQAKGAGLALGTRDPGPACGRGLSQESLLSRYTEQAGPLLLRSSAGRGPSSDGTVIGQSLLRSGVASRLGAWARRASRPPRGRSVRPVIYPEMSNSRASRCRRGPGLLSRVCLSQPHPSSRVTGGERGEANPPAEGEAPEPQY